MILSKTLKHTQTLAVALLLALMANASFATTAITKVQAIAACNQLNGVLPVEDEDIFKSTKYMPYCRCRWADHRRYVDRMQSVPAVKSARENPSTTSGMRHNVIVALTNT